MSHEGIASGILFEDVFATSPEKAIAAAKKPSTIMFDIFEPPLPIRGIKSPISGATKFVGATIALSANLYSKVDTTVTPLTGKVVNIYHKVDTGPYEKIGSPTVDSYGYAEITHVLAAKGTHTYYAEFPGDSEYEGCAQKARNFAQLRAR